MSSGSWPRIREGLRTAIVGILLSGLVVSSVVDDQGAFLLTVLAGWVLLPLVVGFRDLLDAGLIFMMVAVGVTVAVGFAKLLVQAQ